MSKLSLGLIGWYGHGNAGDERILYCLRRLFTDYEIVPFGGFDDAWRRLNELNSCDRVILGGGGLVLRGYGRYAPLLNSIQPPFYAAGISVESTHRDVRPLIDAIRSKARGIHVRDQASATVFNCNHCIAGPDLTFLDPFPVQDVRKDDVCGLNIRNWHYWDFELFSPAHNLMQRLDNGILALNRIYPFRKWQPKEVKKIVHDSFSEVRPIPLCSSPPEEGAASSLQNIEQLFSPCRYVIGMRYHSLVFACQIAVPFVSLSYQPKNSQFCKEVSLPAASIDIYSLHGLPEAIAFMRENYDIVRNKLLEYRQEACWLISEQMTRFAQQVAHGNS